MLTIEELEKRVERDRELYDKLTEERRAAYLRLHRNEKRISFLKELEKLEKLENEV
jgi:hypothetical protein